MPELDKTWWHEAPLAVILQEARRAYVQRVRAGLAGGGMGDMPHQGARVVAGIQHNGTNARDVSAELGISKQAVSKLIDSLVDLDYVERVPDPDDRRVVTIGLTERGRAAATIVKEAVDSVDEELLAKIGEEGAFGMRRGLAMLIGIAYQDRQRTSATE